MREKRSVQNQQISKKVNQIRGGFLAERSILLSMESWNRTDNPQKIINYTICQLVNNNSYSSITSFGRIDSSSPDPADATIMAEIDSMIASLTKQ